MALKYSAEWVNLALPGLGGRSNDQRGGNFKDSDGRDRQIATLRDRLSRLRDASLRVNESLGLDDVLQGVLHSPLTMTDARFAVTSSDSLGITSAHWNPACQRI